MDLNLTEASTKATGGLQCGLRGTVCWLAPRNVDRLGGVIIDSAVWYIIDSAVCWLTPWCLDWLSDVLTHPVTYDDWLRDFMLRCAHPSTQVRVFCEEESFLEIATTWKIFSPVIRQPDEWYEKRTSTSCGMDRLGRAIADTKYLTERYYQPVSSSHHMWIYVTVSTTTALCSMLELYNV